MVSKTLMMFFALVALVATVQSVPQCPAEDGAGPVYFPNPDDCQ